MKRVNEIQLPMRPVTHVSEITVRYRKRKLSNKSYHQSSDIADVFRRFWANDIEFRERMYAMYLDVANHVIGIFEVSMGSDQATSFDPLMILQMAFLTHSKRFIIAHNHPSGNLQPSTADRLTTKILRRKADEIGMELLDSLIITKEGYKSI